ncbi:MAG: hypothetical protein LBQ62_00595 [Candidatus Accumulibacter sp.]|jgi:hypothetical protein|nr:hypothetical protein [Accumulibacter sp.]
MGNEILELLNDEASVKILVTVDEHGLPHPAVKSSLRYCGGEVIYLEYLESSRTNRGMTRSLWYEKDVVILLARPGEKSFVIVAHPVRALVCGKEFQRYYEEVQRERGDFDLAAVWIMKPLAVTDQSLDVRVAEETARHPHFMHLDRLAKYKETP